MGQAFRDQPRSYISSARFQHATRAPVVATLRSFCPQRARTRDALQVEATPGHELPKSERRSVAEFTFRGALRAIGFRGVEAQAKRLASDADRVAV
jgi:hypothetical protein